MGTGVGGFVGKFVGVLVGDDVTGDMGVTDGMDVFGGRVGAGVTRGRGIIEGATVVTNGFCVDSTGVTIPSPLRCDGAIDIVGVVVGNKNAGPPTSLNDGARVGTFSGDTTITGAEVGALVGCEVVGGSVNVAEDGGNVGCFIGTWLGDVLD